MATQAKPHSFQDREYFPSFRDCPLEYSWDDRYLRKNSENASVNRKHWCLLGEIIEANTIIRPRIVAKDHKGDSFVVAFYADDQNDMPRLLKHFKVGNTIVIFYPSIHYFLDGSIGVRVEDTGKIQIIPLSFKEVLEMNKQVIQYIVAEGTQRKCHGCDSLKENLNGCGRCTLFHYCNKDCQTKAWSEKDHKKLCKVLSREDVRRMHFLKYGTYDGAISFA
ncbi:uncharacterized protein F4812DRAFT_459823 [Daldinia caldariorum]|uniref:uncharacterized protein n=1 Tax=Daldinia caldariorum TaxID=326644 RepID=UPI00200838CD|nr:uncharacterized protein F4812DRAFT_459823 [Daldinia caldariorum]KAI1467719.1 hypothetical protein F4812DRAFT_459823 [Daldinia caldariorum]